MENGNIVFSIFGADGISTSRAFSTSSGTNGGVRFAWLGARMWGVWILDHSICA
jgi:hypothetical protein